MKVNRVTGHRYNDYSFKLKGDLDSVGAQGEIEKDPEWQANNYSVTCMQYVPEFHRIFCGTTNFKNNLLQTFDPETKQFECMNYADFCDDPFEIKIHRSLAMGKDGWLYGATSCLHREDKRLQAPGGKIFRFDYPNRIYETVAIPCPQDYIQTITLDPERELIYGFSYPVFNFFVYSLKEKKVIYTQYMASIPHLSTLDDDGCYWATWSHGHYFFKYDPSINDVVFFNHGFPEKCQCLMYHNAGPIDMAVNIGDGSIYFGEEKGGLFRLAPETAELTFLGKPFSSPRMPGLCKGPGNTLLIAGGSDGATRLACYDFDTGAFRDLGPIVDGESGIVCFRVHDLSYANGSMYIGETDHPSRSSWLWEAELEL